MGTDVLLRIVYAQDIPQPLISAADVTLYINLFIMVYGYIRVSTDSQSVQNQRFEIEKFCHHEALTIDEWVEETISGTKAYGKRQLGKLLRRAREGDLIVCSELSRLGRSLFMIMEILSQCMAKGIRVWTIKDHYRLGDDIQSKVLAFAFALSAEIERNLISQRTREALDLRRAQGIRLGRPVGAQNRSYKLDARKRQICRLLSQSVPHKEIARRCHVSPQTLSRWIRRNL